MITKTFQYKGQAINYYNKVRNNPHCESCYLSFSCERGCWVVEYWYGGVIGAQATKKV